MATEKQQLKVIAFYDGRPGHEKQTRGILRELGQIVDLDLTEVRVRRMSLLAELVDLADLFISRRARRDGDPELACCSAPGPAPMFRC